MVKAVIDTSVFISAFLSKDSEAGPSAVLSSWRRAEFTLVMSPQLLRELVAIMRRCCVQDSFIEDVVRVVKAKAFLIPGAYEATRLDCIDPADNKFLAAAYESQADYLVSLDTMHILPLKHYYGTQILLPTLFLRTMAVQGYISSNPVGSSVD